MGFIQKSFPEISKDCFNWLAHSKDPQKEIKCNLNEVDVIIVFTRMCSSGNVKIPNRINVCPDTASIIELFKKYLHQPDSLLKEDKRLWVFKDNSHVNVAAFQYELRFFSNEAALNTQLADEIKSQNESGCAIQ